VVKIEELPAELEKRNALSSANPIRVIYEWRYTWNLTLIDTPGTCTHSVTYPTHEQVMTFCLPSLGLMMDCAVSTPDTSVGNALLV
jgi:hypothetical protein